MKKITLLAFNFFCFFWTATAQLQSPSEFLPHQLGEQFTPHHMLVDYMEHVAENSDQVLLTRYGYTNEDRPLVLAFISTPENLARLEAIRENNLRRAGFLDGNTDRALDRALVWLSFSVHGNEASGSEASMQVIYELADPNNTRTQSWLENTVVILDPSINPDGYSRYTHWYRGVSHKRKNADPNTMEMSEPWPRGRVNHYLFDLNRDWAWQTQVESQQRMAVYQQWYPHVHADLHEMGRNSHYYFAPAARPYHEYITDWQVDFQKTIGRNHADYFDKEGWLYFTRETFDLLYPSYGDTYPTYHGAIGMTYEQAGQVGRAIATDNGDTLTLVDRVKHHTTTALSTVEVSSRNAQQLIAEFEKYFREAQNDPPGEYKTFVIKGDNPSGRLRSFAELLDKNQIQYGRPARTGNYRGFDYTTGEETTFQLEENDFVVSAYQPKATFIQILLEPAPALEDSVTYDITAWALPYAYGLRTYGLTEKVNVQPGYSFGEPQNKPAPAPYAYVAEWKSLADARFLSQALDRGVKARFAEKAFTLQGVEYAPGTLIFNRADNRSLGAAFDRIMQEAAKDGPYPLRSVSTGMVDAGSDFGARSMTLIQTPRIAVISGEGTSANAYGQVWYYLEQSLDYPFTSVTADQLGRFDLDDYNVLILPEGYYSLSNAAANEIAEWVSGGGRLIAIGGANRILSRHDRLSLKQNGSSNNEEEDPLESYEGRVRRSISEDIPGAIFKVNLDNTHPLGFGLDQHFFSLKTNTLSYPYQEGAWNVGTIDEDPMILGFAGVKAREEMRETAVFVVKGQGRGAIIYLVDNPLFRGFWENGKFLFSNALFFAGQ
jgi:hypothetical protein